jgi:hypothetical protein
VVPYTIGSGQDDGPRRRRPPERSSREISGAIRSQRAVTSRTGLTTTVRQIDRGQHARPSACRIRSPHPQEQRSKAAATAGQKQLRCATQAEQQIRRNWRLLGARTRRRQIGHLQPKELDEDLRRRPSGCCAKAPLGTHPAARSPRPQENFPPLATTAGRRRKRRRQPELEAAHILLEEGGWKSPKLKRRRQGSAPAGGADLSAPSSSLQHKAEPRQKAGNYPRPRLQAPHLPSAALGRHRRREQPRFGRLSLESSRVL